MSHSASTVARLAPWARIGLTGREPTEIELLRAEVEALRETIEERIPRPSPIIRGDAMWEAWRALQRGDNDA